MGRLERLNIVNTDTNYLEDIMNEISKYESNLYEKYKDYVTKHEPITNQKELSQEDAKLVNMALNATFLNPKFKMKHFVSMGQITPFATVRQWVLELKTMEENCETMESMIRRLEIQEDIARLRIERETDPLNIRELQLELEKASYDRRANSRRLATHYIEREQYVELIKEYIEGPNGKTPEGKSWLDVLGTPEADYWEKHYWTVRLARQASMDVVAYGRISSGNMEAINELADDHRNECLALAHEMSLRLTSLSDSIRQHVHNELMINDPAYAAINRGSAAPKDPNYVELNLSVHGQAHNAEQPPSQQPPKNNGELLDVYHP
jgi:hypothetical protein